MAWIKVIAEEEAQGPLKEIYDKSIQPWGGVDNIEKIHSLDPDSLKWHLEMYKQLMYGRGSSLKRAQREMIAVAVSSFNKCHY